jgi:hypothetical protein
MRLWSVHPEYLDRQGLLAVWREALLARQVLRGQTVGYRHHPQLERFRAQPRPLDAIEAYLWAILREAQRRGYRFAADKLRPLAPMPAIPVTQGQLDYEWQRLQRKLRVRAPGQCDALAGIKQPQPHPLFTPVAGAVAGWERIPPEAS